MLIARSRSCVYDAMRAAMSCETPHTPPHASGFREVAERERDLFPAKRIPIRSPRHREFADAVVTTPRSLYQSTICASHTRPIEIKEDPWYAAQHHIPKVPLPARTGRKVFSQTFDGPAFPKDPMEVNKQQIRMLRDQARICPGLLLPRQLRRHHWRTRSSPIRKRA
jgi:hypothetical protein